MNKKIILIILDGFGLRKETYGNAIALAKKPNIDQLFHQYPHTTLKACGMDVGLPNGQMGNSEVGHLNIGAGRIIYTGLSLINKAINDHEFEKNVAFIKAINHAKQYNSKLHIWGLISYGGVHSHIEHVIALVRLAQQNQVSIVIHCVSDGRDVSPNSFVNDISQIINLCNDTTKIGTISGRYYAMDRDKRWERVDQAYQTMVGNPRNKFSDAKQYIQDSYINGISDEFILPALNNQYDKNEITINDNDAIIFANFRPDRARELSHCIFNSNYYDFQPSKRYHNLFFVTMMTYEGITPSMVAYPQTTIKNTLGEVLSNNNLKQLRIAETEKYAHVTFFFDGGIETTYPNETKIIIPSPKVATYDLKPEMSAYEVCDKILQQMDSQDVIIANFANLDMIGHTGELNASIKAVEIVDECVGKIYQKSLSLGTTMFVTADHGNIEKILDENNQKYTSHTLSLVPFLVTKKDIKLIDGKLSNIAPTILDFLNINIPEEMNEHSLIIR